MLKQIVLNTTKFVKAQKIGRAMLPRDYGPDGGVSKHFLPQGRISYYTTVRGPDINFQDKIKNI